MKYPYHVALRSALAYLAVSAFIPNCEPREASTITRIFLHRDPEISPKPVIRKPEGDSILDHISIPEGSPRKAYIEFEKSLRDRAIQHASRHER